MASFKRLIPTLGLILFLMSCSSLRFASQPVMIAKAVEFKLLPPHVAQGEYVIVQNVQATFEGKTYELLVQIEQSSSHLVMVAFMPTGTRLAKIEYSEGVMTSEQLSVLPESFPAEQLLAGYQLSHWPINELEQQIEGAGVSFTEYTGSPRKRLLSQQGLDLIEIGFDRDNEGKDRVSYIHNQWGYHIISTTLSKKRL